MTTRLGIQSDYDVTQRPTVFDDFSHADTVTRWPSTAITEEADTTYFKAGTQSLKLSGTLAGDRVHRQSISPAWDFSSHGVIKLRFFAVNLPANGNIVLRLSRATSVSGNNISYTVNRNTIQDGWNELCIHTDEDSTTHKQGNAWAVVGATVDFTVAMQSCAIEMAAMTDDSSEVYLDSIEFQPRSRPKLMIGFDANAESVETNALPYMTAANMKSYIAAEGSLGVGSFSTSTKTDRLHAFYNAGWDIIGHTVTHPDMTGLADYDAFVAEMTPNFAEIERLGFTRGLKHFAYPGGTTDATVVGWMQTYGTWTARSYGNWYTSTSTYGLLNPHWFGAIDLSVSNNLAAVKKVVDAAILYGGTGSIFGHEIDAVADATTWTVADFESLIDYVGIKVRDGLIDVVTPSEWYDGFTEHKRSAI